jgi:hypothetical protein
LEEQVVMETAEAEAEAWARRAVETTAAPALRTLEFQVKQRLHMRVVAVVEQTQVQELVDRVGVEMGVGAGDLHRPLLALGQEEAQLELVEPE